ncbi:MAG: hypothetical protein LBB36_04760 [Fibromonadaceae bacterium]|jgi:hypothetical protein|nr:hypothetical protein [Fibromonadaceae bacterium]
MNTITQAYRTTCIPNRADRIDTLIPPEYVGREIEIVMYPVYDDQPEYNEETLAAIQESRDIMSGKIKAKSYDSMEELYADIDAEEDD